MPINLKMVLKNVVCYSVFSIFLFASNPYHCLTGVYPGAISSANIGSWETVTESEVGSVLYYLTWGDGTNENWPDTALGIINGKNATAHIVWEPFLSNSDVVTDTIVDKITNGLFDPYIYAMADRAKNYKKPVFLRFAHEMNGDWYAWDGTHNGQNVSAALKYKAMWRYVVGIFDKEGVYNVKWVWSPNERDTPHEPWNDMTNYYPGDGYVDWFGIDGYNWVNTTDRSFEEIFTNAMKRIQTLNPAIPIMIGETGSADDPQRDTWFTEAFDTLENDPVFSNVRAFFYFNTDKERQWAVSDSETGDSLERSAIRSAYNRSYFLSSIDINLYDRLSAAGRPSMPSDFTITTVSTNQIGLSWNDTATNESTYRVFYEIINDKPQTPAALLLPDTQSYTLTGLMSGMTYYIWVDATNEVGAGQYVFTNVITSGQPAIETVIDNFEDSNMSGNLYNGTWEINESSGVSTSSSQWLSGDRSDTAFRYDYDITAGAGWGVNIKYVFSQNQNLLEHYTGFRFSVKGSGDTTRCEIISPEITDYNHYGSFWLSSESDWVTYEFTWETLYEGWASQSVPTNEILRNTSAFSFVVPENSGDGWIAIDNVELILKTDILPKPGSLSAYVLGENEIYLTWEDRAASEDHYRVYINTANVRPALADVYLSADSESYTVTGLTAGTDYYFWVDSTNKNGAGLSASVSALTSGTNLFEETNVFVYYSEDYITDISSLNHYVYGGATSPSTFTDGGRTVLEVTDLPSGGGLGFGDTSGFTAHDLSFYSGIYIRLKASAGSEFSFGIKDNAGVQMTTSDYKINADEGFEADGSWYSIQILKKDFNTILEGSGILDWGNISELKFTGQGSSGADHLYIDEIYFYHDPPQATIPESPDSLMFAPHSNKISLYWIDRATNENGYTVYYSNNNDKPVEKMISLLADATNYTVSNLIKGNTYYFWVDCYNRAGTSGYISGIKTALTPGNEPAVYDEIVFSYYSDHFLEDITLFQQYTYNDVPSPLRENEGGTNDYYSVTNLPDTGVWGFGDYSAGYITHDLSGYSNIHIRLKADAGALFYFGVQDGDGTVVTTLDWAIDTDDGFAADGSWYDIIMCKDDLSQKVEGTAGMNWSAVKSLRLVGSPSSTGSVSIDDIYFYNAPTNKNFIKPSAPDGLIASASSGSDGTNQIDLSWTDNATNEAHYRLFTNTVNVKPSSAAFYLGADTESYTVSNLSPAVTYYFWLDCTNAVGACAALNASETTAGIPGAPAGPSNLLVSVAGLNQIDLSWTDNATNEVHYRIFTNISNVKPSAAAFYGAVDTSSKGVTGLNAGTRYYFWVDATNAAGVSSDLSASAVTFDVPSPASGLTAVTNAVRPTNQIDLSWTDNATNEVHYRLFTNTVNVKPSSAAFYLGADTASYTVSNLSSAVTYYFWLDCTNMIGSSDEVSVLALTAYDSLAVSVTNFIRIDDFEDHDKFPYPPWGLWQQDNRSDYPTGSGIFKVTNGELCYSYTPGTGSWATNAVEVTAEDSLNLEKRSMTHLFFSVYNTNSSAGDLYLLAEGQTNGFRAVYETNLGVLPRVYSRYVVDLYGLTFSSGFHSLNIIESFSNLTALRWVYRGSGGQKGELHLDEIFLSNTGTSVRDSVIEIIHQNRAAEVSVQSYTRYDDGFVFDLSRDQRLQFSFPYETSDKALTERASLKLLSVKGQKIAEAQAVINQNRCYFYWDGQFHDGRKAGSGVYIFSAKVGDRRYRGLIVVIR